MTTERYTRGLNKLNEVTGDVGQSVMDALKSVSPDLACYTIEFPFGDVYSRKGLDNKSREIATISALTVLGMIPQLKPHIKAGLHVGLTQDEIKEIIIQMAVYGGFPCAINAMMAAKEVFDSMK